MTPDVKDRELLLLRIAARQALRTSPSIPLVGDWGMYPDKTLVRFTYDWGTGIQTTWKDHGFGSFYLDRSGRADYSGSLDIQVPYDQIAPTDLVKDALFWFFHHDQPRAHSGVEFMISTPIWTLPL